MRTDQYIGLSSRASQFVKRMKRRKHGGFEGAFYSEFPLYCYRAGKNRYHEIRQCESWSSGPMFFITLKERRDLDWTADEIEEACGERPFDQEDLDEMREGDLHVEL